MFFRFVFLILVSTSFLFADVCSRTDSIVRALQHQLSKPCNMITDNDLAKINDLSVRSISSLNENDFQGLYSLKSLDLIGNNLTTLPENIFLGLSSLEVLLLSYNYLTTLPENIFSGLSSLKVLKLDNNNITELPENIFRDLSLSFCGVELSNNKLTKEYIEKLKQQWPMIYFIY